jgi:hypothetical protein
METRSKKRKPVEEDKEEAVGIRKGNKDEQSVVAYTESVNKGKSAHKAMLKGRIHSDLNYDVQFTRLREEMIHTFTTKETITDRDMLYYKAVVK